MNKAHIAPLGSLLDPHPLHAWPDTTEVFRGVTVRKQAV
jgi:hypothetical protein